MRELRFDNGHRATLAGSIFELRASAYNDFQYWLLREAGIGAGADAVVRHFEAVSSRLAAAAGDAAQLPLAADELALLHYSFNDTLDRLNCQQLAFGCLVVEVDGRPVRDRSEEGLRRLIEQFSEWGLTQGMVEAEVRGLKKAVRRELEAHFPAQFSAGDLETTHYYDQVQQRLLALCDYLADGAAQHLERVREIEAWLLEQNEPQIFDEGDERNVLVAHKRRFGERCAALSELGYPGAGEFTVFDFHAAVGHLLAKQRPAAATD